MLLAKEKCRCDFPVPEAGDEQIANINSISSFSETEECTGQEYMSYSELQVGAGSMHSAQARVVPLSSSG